MRLYNEKVLNLMKGLKDEDFLQVNDAIAAYVYTKEIPELPYYLEVIVKFALSLIEDENKIEENKKKNASRSRKSQKKNKLKESLDTVNTPLNPWETEEVSQSKAERVSVSESNCTLKDSSPVIKNYPINFNPLAKQFNDYEISSSIEMDNRLLIEGGTDWDITFEGP